MITGSSYLIRTIQSLGYFLKAEQFQKDGSANTLTGAYTNINVMVGFPDSLEKLTLPTLALVHNDAIRQNDSVFASHRSVKTVPLSFTIYGFVGGGETPNHNMYTRDELCNDVRELLEDTDYIKLYDYPDFDTEVGDMSVESVESRFIEPTGITNADKYRFVIELECEYAKSV